jgi:hypothetical protein
MTNLQSIIIPGIVTGLIGGITLFLAAYSYYPEKHLNVNIDGKCFEFLDTAFTDYGNLEFDNEILTKVLQTKAIGEPTTMVPVSYVGSELQVDKFIHKYPLEVTNYYKQQGSHLVADKIVIKGKMKNSDIVTYLEDISKNKETVINRNSLHNFGILPNKYISGQESNEISKTIDMFMENGLKAISVNDNGVNKAECRTKIVYGDTI